MNERSNSNDFDVIVVGGSYSGLAAAMALGRALRRVLVIDGGKPCNRQTPHSHNFVTHDGRPPAEIAMLARSQVEAYDTVSFFDGLATQALPGLSAFTLQTDSNDSFHAQKLILATGIRDLLPAIPGFAECWGISVLHCPYCHGYEVRNQATGILVDGQTGFEFASLIANWTTDLVLFTNGSSTCTPSQNEKLRAHNIRVMDSVIDHIEHIGGRLQYVVLNDGARVPLSALYTRPAFEQHSSIPEALSCEMTEAGYIETDAAQRTSIAGVYACGDNSSSMRTVANAVGAGTTAGMMANRDLVLERF